MSDFQSHQALRIVVLDSDPLLASVWQNVLNAREGIKSVQAIYAPEQVKDITTPVDVFLLCVSNFVEAGLSWARTVAAARPDVKLVVAGLPPEEHIVLTYIEAGATQFIPHDASAEVAIETILSIRDGECAIQPDLAPAFIHRLAALYQEYRKTDSFGRQLEMLTPRENEVLNLLAEDMSNREIATELTIELGTVKNHVHNILSKLELNSRHQAAMYLKSIELDSAMTTVQNEAEGGMSLGK